MKKIYVTAFTLFINLCSYAQNFENIIYYENSTKIKIQSNMAGNYQKFYNNEVMSESGTFKNGMYLDTLKRYYNNGILNEIKIFNKKGELNGIQKTFRNNGSLILEFEALNGVKIGSLKRYKNDLLVKEIKFKQNSEVKRIDTYNYESYKWYKNSYIGEFVDYSLVKGKCKTFNVKGKKTEQTIINKKS